MHTSIHILNKILIKINSEKSPYDLWKGIRANAKHFKVLGSKCYIKRKDKKIGKFDS
jgi:hypothetical protein